MDSLGNSWLICLSVDQTLRWFFSPCNQLLMSVWHSRMILDDHLLSTMELEWSYRVYGRFLPLYYAFWLFPDNHPLLMVKIQDYCSLFISDTGWSLDIHCKCIIFLWRPFLFFHWYRMFDCKVCLICVDILDCKWFIYDYLTLMNDLTWTFAICYGIKMILQGLWPTSSSI